MTTLIALIVLFLILSALFSGSEIAFISVNKLSIEVRRKSGGRRGKVLASFYDDPKAFISSMLVGNNITLVIFTTLMTSLLSPLFETLIGEGPTLLLVNTMVITIVILIFGEFLPKTVFRLYSGELLYILTYPLAFFRWLLVIPTWLMSGLSEWLIKRVMRVNVDAQDYRLSRLDLEQFVVDKVDDEDQRLEKELFINALNLKQIKVRECMVPRTEIVAVDVNDTLDTLISIITDTRHSRILVQDGDVDQILGYIHHQDLIDKPGNIKKILREILFIPETMSVQDLLSRFIKNGSSIACVVDEYGGLAGLITMEDILEEIFGEIEDEHDDEDLLETQISPNEYRFSARLELDYLDEKYEDISFPEGDYHTLSGYITMTTGNIPEQGDVIDIPPYRFHLEMVSETKIETVRLEILPPEEEPQVS
ncbi:MAG: hemolysin family protein [Saprospiraceae bacterium]|nr:hemolysin family protein [Saprospiraceae bacterium]